MQCRQGLLRTFGEKTFVRFCCFNKLLRDDCSNYLVTVCLTYSVFHCTAALCCYWGRNCVILIVCMFDWMCSLHTQSWLINFTVHGKGVCLIIFSSCQGNLVFDETFLWWDFYLGRDRLSCFNLTFGALIPRCVFSPRNPIWIDFCPSYCFSIDCLHCERGVWLEWNLFQMYC